MELLPQTTAEQLPRNPIRVETALSRYPIHRLARHGDAPIDIYEKNDTGEIKWEVSHNSKYGQPGPLAYKLDTLIINRRIEETARPISRIIKLGSLRDICRELGISEGENVNTIRNALRQNAFAAIVAKITYRLSDGSEDTLEADFNRYSVVFRGEKLPNGRSADAVYIVLNDVFVKIINGAMTRPLDYDYLKSLPPAPQRFYELLSYQVYAAIKNDRARAKLTYSDFCAHAPQTRHLEWSRVRNQMNKVHQPHKKSGYILKVDYQDTTDSDGNPDWVMLYQPGPKARAEFRAFAKRGGPTMLEVESYSDPIPQLAAVEASPLEKQLGERGITGKIAAELVRDHGEERIRKQIEILDWRLEGKKAEKIDDPAAWLVSAIRHPHADPKGFVSAAERQKRLEAKKASKRQEDAAQRLEREQDARNKAEWQAIAAYWESLNPEQQAELDATAKAQADPAELAKEVGPMKKIFQQVRRDQHIRQLLASRAADTTTG